MITFIGVIAVLVLLTILLIALAAITGRPDHVVEERAALEHERIEARLQGPAAVRLSGEPMPELAVAEQAAPAAPAAADLTPQQIYENTCMVCHAAGVSGAPRSGEEADWAPRLSEAGFDELVDNAITGIGAMPPRGGNSNLTDEQIEETVRFMLSEAGLTP